MLKIFSRNSGKTLQETNKNMNYYKNEENDILTIVNN